MSNTAPETRSATATDAVAESYVTQLAALDPILATDLGLAGHDHRLPDLSPSGIAERAELHRATLGELEAIEPEDEVDRITHAAMRERLGLQLELFDAGELHRELNIIYSPVQTLREVFDLMPTATAQDWENIAQRLSAIPEALAGYRESLELARERGHVAARRQVEACRLQALELAEADSSFFTSFTAEAEPGGEEPAEELTAALTEGAAAAREAYRMLALHLEELAADAPEKDGVGKERYALWSRFFLGATVDLEETYEWGLAELDRIIAEQEATAAELYGEGTGVREAMDRLDADPARKLEGTEALREWMQATSDEAIEALAGSRFDIPEPVRRLECLIAPTQSGGIYYTGPSADFSRPGRMWWSVPSSVTEFSTWREKTTVYHEGVPGHHLQVGQTVYRSGLLNSWRRMACWVSGHGEGWALYAERLMADLGFLDDPGDRMGMLDGQRLRAARVVLDIGVHLGKPMPQRWSQWGTGTWDQPKAWKFLQANANMDEDFLAFELNRYLGWPGQAPSYKVGQRLWEEFRDAAEADATRRGENFDLSAFHRRALDVGSVGLDVLREALR
ncbi:DUF885 domain-containing protein [Bogoriella caseilytica]|uniref:Uncharacterized protein (DUF885 family) n=1 Tax=Bogoriella caseilytica TaxID=56055 RepID=A0A3N2BA53_9MICO|nr:DUF885 domain-containing protein [Bogoriella caseilytica]ROR72135.1 uncharacterized protein (DUF885 family) [Bogoriella caseilytica]